MATTKRIGALAGILATLALGAAAACSSTTTVVREVPAQQNAASGGGSDLTAIAEHEVTAHGGKVTAYLPIGPDTGYAAGDGKAANSTVKCYAGDLGIADAQADLAVGAVYGTQNGVHWGCVDR